MKKTKWIQKGGILAALLLLAVFLYTPQAAQAAEILMVGAGEQYTDIQTAVDAAKPGDTVLIKDGLYIGKVTISKSGAEGSPITVKADGDGARIFGNVIITGNYVRLEGLKLYAYRAVSEEETTTVNSEGKTVLASGECAEVLTAPDGHRYILSPDRGTGVSIRGHHIDVIGNRILDAFGSGMGISKLNDTVTCTNINIKNNYMRNVDCGIMTQSCYYLTIENNEIDTLSTYALLSGGNADSDFFRLFGEYIILRGNYCHGTVAGEHLRGSHCDFVQGFTVNRETAKNILIENNVVDAFHHEGFMVSNSAYADDYHISDWVIRNNVIRGYTAWGACLGWSTGGAGLKNIVIENNAFLGEPNARGEGLKTYYGINMNGTGGSLSVRNNIIMNSGSAYGAGNGAVLVDSGNNMTYNTGNPPAADTNYVGVDPLFVLDETGQFRYLKGSPALAAGIGPDPTMPITEGWFSKEVKLSTWNSFDDFSMIQGQRQWYYLYLFEGKYLDMSPGAYQSHWTSSPRDVWNCRLLVNRAVSSADKKMVRAWKAPEDGLITIKSDFMKYNPKSGTTAASIKVGDKEIWNKNITNTADGKQYIEEITAVVKKDDMVYFIQEQGAAFWEQEITLLTEFIPDRNDMNKDGFINISDLATIARNIGKTSEDAGWTSIEHCDVNTDGSIDILDLSTVAKLL